MDMQPGNTTCDLVIKSQVKIGQKLRPGVKIGSLKNSEGIFLISINNFEKKIGSKN